MGCLVNGERTVVMFFVGRVVFFAMSSSLLPHALALAFLALAALSLDSSDSISLFNTRPGASSGILLGAVTLPSMMLSKLVQMSRAVSLKETELQEFEHLTMQYWAASACCLGVLLLLCVVLWRNKQSRVSDWHLNFCLSCIVFYVALCCGSLGSISLTGFNTVLKMLWMFFHGLAAVKLIQHLLTTFRSCASIGEALLVTSGLVLYLSDLLAFTIAKASRFLFTDEVVRYGSKRSEIGIIVQGMILGLLLLPTVYKFVLRIWESHYGSRTCNEIQRSLLFFSIFTFIMIGTVPAWMQFVQDFHMHPLLWVFSFVCSEPLKRLSLCIYWVLVISFSVVQFYNISKSSKLERILLRKYYHLMAVLMFLPALIFQPMFLDLAFGAALGVFMTLEIVRVWRIWPLGQLVHNFMNAFTDHRDSELLIVSHFSLLLGCALPIWMSSGFNDRPVAPFAGILSLGIGDTMASMVGYKYGVLRWSKTGKKTIEGTAAGITSVLATCSVLLPLLAATGYIVTERWLSLVVAVTVSGLLEAYTTQLDNAFIPLVFYGLLCL